MSTRVVCDQRVLAVPLAAATLALVCWAAVGVWSSPCLSPVASVLPGQACPPPRSVLLPLLIALAFWCVGAVTAFRPQPLSELSFYCAVAGTLAMGDLSTIGSDLAARLFYTLLGWLAPATVGFFFALAARAPGRKGRLLLLGLAVLAALESLPSLVYSFERAGDQPWFDLWRAGVRLTFVSAFLVATVWLRHAYRHAAVRARRRVRFVVAGTALGFAPLFLLALVPETLNAPMRLPYDFAFPWLLLCPTSFAYARVRHRLVRVEAVLARALVFYLNLVLAVGLFIVVTWLVVGIGPFWPSSGLAGTSERLSLGVLASVAFVCVVVPLQPILRQTIRWILYGQEVPGERILADFSWSLGRLLDRDKLRRYLTEDLPAAMGFSTAALYLREPGVGLVLVEEGTHRRACLESSALALPKAFADYLSSMVGPRTGDAIGRALAEGRPGWAAPCPGLVASNVLCLPLASDGDMQGVLFIEARPDDTFFTAEDRRILALLSSQAGVAAYNVRLVEEVRAKGEEVARAHRRVLVAREQERLRVARELHDGALQQVLGVSRLLEVLDSRQQRDAGAVYQIEGLTLNSLREELLTAAAVLREVSGELRPAWLRELGLTAALRSHFAHQVGDGTRAPRLVLDLEESETELPEGVAIVLFRIAQEAVRNAVSHAGAANVELRLCFLSHDAELAVRDDGRGFNPPPRFAQLAEAGHFGLVGMAERAELVGGRLSIHSKPGAGTEIVARVPLAGCP